LGERRKTIRLESSEPFERLRSRSDDFQEPLSPERRRKTLRQDASEPYDRPRSRSEEHFEAFDRRKTLAAESSESPDRLRKLRSTSPSPSELMPATLASGVSPACHPSAAGTPPMGPAHTKTPPLSPGSSVSVRQSVHSPPHLSLPKPATYAATAVRPSTTPTGSGVMSPGSRPGTTPAGSGCRAILGRGSPCRSNALPSLQVGGGSNVDDVGGGGAGGNGSLAGTANEFAADGAAPTRSDPPPPRSVQLLDCPGLSGSRENLRAAHGAGPRKSLKAPIRLNFRASMLKRRGTECGSLGIPADPHGALTGAARSLSERFALCDLSFEYDSAPGPPTASGPWPEFGTLGRGNGAARGLAGANAHASVAWASGATPLRGGQRSPTRNASICQPRSRVSRAASVFVPQ